MKYFFQLRKKIFISGAGLTNSGASAFLSISVESSVCEIAPEIENSLRVELAEKKIQKLCLTIIFFLFCVWCFFLVNI